MFKNCVKLKKKFLTLFTKHVIVKRKHKFKRSKLLYRCCPKENKVIVKVKYWLVAKPEKKEMPTIKRMETQYTL